MTAKLIQIGNSMGIRLPKAMIEQAGLRDEVEIEYARGRIVVRPPRHPRAGWDQAFARAVCENGADVDSDWLNVPNQFDSKDWKW